MSKRFPRPRGDGPAGPGDGCGGMRVPPPTRGWPPSRGGLLAWARGSPAHAGMARSKGGLNDRSHRFPRPRGDGPLKGPAGPTGPTVPPPTRGWPPRRRIAWRQRDGSPAHAGMAPKRVKGHRRVRWFPRPRGDGPVGTVNCTAIVKVPPPTRGWPRFIQIINSLLSGSPAHAGMAPMAETSGCCRTGFPRPRGDGPQQAAP